MKTSSHSSSADERAMSTAIQGPMVRPARLICLKPPIDPFYMSPQYSLKVPGRGHIAAQAPL